MQTILSLRGVQFAYRKSPAPVLKGINLEIKEGEFFALLGPNCAGKSTLCYCLNGLIPHSIRGNFSGEILLSGKNIAQMTIPEIAPLASIVFQDFESQLFSTNVKLEIAFGPENIGIAPEQIDRIVHETLMRVGLTGLENRQPANLSGGQKQRLAIGSVLAMDPKLLILDEPTTDLDPVGRDGIIKILDRLRSERQRTLVVVEHEVEEIISADRIAILQDGKIIDSGKPIDVLANSSKLRNLGIRPPQMLEIGENLGIKPPEQSVNGMWSRMNSGNWVINPKKYEHIVTGENARYERYGTSIIQMDSVNFGYDAATPVLKNMGLEIRTGEFIAVIGQNGSGKTTLAKLIIGLLKPGAGEISLHGKPIKSYTNRDLAHIVGYVFQNPDHQIFARTVEEEVAFSPRISGVSGKQLEERVASALRSVGLENDRKSDPFLLTKGGRQKVAVASLLAAACEVLIFDEPTTGLDFSEIQKMMRLVTGLNNSGKTIIMITHNMHIVAEFAHRAIIMNNGEIVLDKPVREAFANEHLLNDMFLKPPPVTSLGNRFGYPVLSTSEFIDLVQKNNEHLPL